MEYADNRISLFSAQWGKCAVTGKALETTDEIHCHHIIPKAKGGTDKYDNLVLVSEPIHRLIHAVNERIIRKYLQMLSLGKKELEKLNKYRIKAGTCEITAYPQNSYGD